MAKNPFWLRGAKGKFAGSVVYKGESGTVIRENVTPSNPQSKAMMAQRIAFSTVSKAAKYMLPIIGQSFQGVGNEKLNRREFLRQNVKQLKQAFLAADNGTPTLLYHAAVKNIKTCIPNPYVISAGELVYDFAKVKYTGEDSALTNAPLNLCVEAGQLAMKFSTTEASTVVVPGAELLMAVLGIEPGTQLTLAAIATNNGAPLWVSEGNDDNNRSAVFLAQRLIAKTADAMPDFTFGISTAGAITTINGTAVSNLNDDLINAMEALFDMDKSSQDLYDYSVGSHTITATASSTSAVISFAATEEALGSVFANIVSSASYTVQAAGAFISKLVDSNWRYSNCQMRCLMPNLTTNASGTPAYFGAQYISAKPSYMKTQQGSESQLYTQAGGTSSTVGE